ncbi:MAG TPA: hypothetical protein EYH32_01050 [Anaerolineae bacterium]|nr:hypothetical protein [Anaerolineae bacterium]
MQKVSMKVGWMWFDSDPQKTFEEKVRLAAKRYREKFGRSPTVCYVNNGQVNGQREIHCGTVHIIGAHNILPHHFWLGIADVSEAEKN